MRALLRGGWRGGGCGPPSPRRPRPGRQGGGQVQGLLQAETPREPRVLAEAGAGAGGLPLQPRYNVTLLGINDETVLIMTSAVATVRCSEKILLICFNYRIRFLYNVVSIHFQLFLFYCFYFSSI